MFRSKSRIIFNTETKLPVRLSNSNFNEALSILFKLLRNEGLSLGTSSGINVAGAIKLAKELGPGHTIVTILCDTAEKYKSKMFNKDFLTKKNLPVPEWL